MSSIGNTLGIPAAIAALGTTSPRGSIVREHMLSLTNLHTAYVQWNETKSYQDGVTLAFNIGTHLTTTNKLSIFLNQGYSAPEQIERDSLFKVVQESKALCAQYMDEVLLEIPLTEPRPLSKEYLPKKS